MLRNETEKQESRFNIRLFNSSKPSHIKALNAIIDAEIAQKNEENKPLNETHAKMVDWLKKYVNCPEFLKSYDDDRSLELVAEATFWSVKLGLEPILAKMSYAEIRGFHPLEELHFQATERTKLISDVCNKLAKPAMSFETSYALGQAAWCVYIHHNSFEKVQEETALYDSGKLKVRKVPL